MHSWLTTEAKREKFKYQQDHCGSKSVLLHKEILLDDWQGVKK